VYTASVYTGAGEREGEGGRAPTGGGAVAAMTTLRHVTLDSTQTFPLKRPTPFIPILQHPPPIYIETPPVHVEKWKKPDAC
jgi:hypothetical protein